MQVNLLAQVIALISSLVLGVPPTSPPPNPDGFAWSVMHEVTRPALDRIDAAEASGALSPVSAQLAREHINDVRALAVPGIASDVEIAIALAGTPRKLVAAVQVSGPGAIPAVLADTGAAIRTSLEQRAERVSGALGPIHQRRSDLVRVVLTEGAGVATVALAARRQVVGEAVDAARTVGGVIAGGGTPAQVRAAIEAGAADVRATALVARQSVRDRVDLARSRVEDSVLGGQQWAVESAQSVRRGSPAAASRPGSAQPKRAKTAAAA